MSQEKPSTIQLVTTKTTTPTVTAMIERRGGAAYPTYPMASITAIRPVPPGPGAPSAAVSG